MQRHVEETALGFSRLFQTAPLPRIRANGAIAASRPLTPCPETCSEAKQRGVEASLRGCGLVLCRACFSAEFSTQLPLSPLSNMLDDDKSEFVSGHGHESVESAAWDVLRAGTLSGESSRAHILADRESSRVSREAASRVLGPPIMVNSESDHSPLEEAAWDGRDGVLRSLLASGVDSVNRCNKGGWTVLMMAARNGHTHCIQTLIDIGGAQVDTRSRMGHSALMSASWMGHLSACLLLISRGADPGQEGEGINAFDLYDCYILFPTCSSTYTKRRAIDEMKVARLEFQHGDEVSTLSTSTVTLRL